MCMKMKCKCVIYIGFFFQHAPPTYSSIYGNGHILILKEPCFGGNICRSMLAVDDAGGVAAVFTAGITLPVGDAAPTATLLTVKV